MNRRSFIKLTALFSAVTLPFVSMAKRKKNISIQLWRHATLSIRLGDSVFLVDPMLSKKGTLDPVKNAGNDIRIPMVELPFSESEIDDKIAASAAVVVTHTHRDHWDVDAQNRIAKDKPLLIQPSDEEAVRKSGFENVTPIQLQSEFKGIKIFRTGGRHGTGEIGLRMGHVSGFVFQFGQAKIYVAGDTIWCTEVETAIKTYQPDIIILNTGEAKFLQGDPITMGLQDVQYVQRAAPKASIIAVHMDTINHCGLTRIRLKSELEKVGLAKKILIPMDGESMDF